MTICGYRVWATIGVSLACAVAMALGACDSDSSSRTTGSGSDSLPPELNAAQDPTYQEVDPVTLSFDDAGSPLLPTCDQYCDLYETTCGFSTSTYVPDGEDAGFTITNRYLDKATCRAVCNGLAPGSWVQTPSGGFSGGTDNDRVCRFAALASKPDSDAAAPLTLAERCGVAGPYGVKQIITTPSALKCGDVCTNYCSLAVKLCAPKVGDLDAGADAGVVPPTWDGRTEFDSCMVACATEQRFPIGLYPDGVSANDGRNTLNCRLYQLQRAARDPAACTNVGSAMPLGGPCSPP